ncbi:unnamed protein product [Brachionus calyciflorus]|uniref:Uncharacterized protein n=1 Tax=Brachionus calyciflorus TaxID=104777 RepID=A0A814A3P0_9BILA|nr:unnamed protein product [Brachionus calyciflorus]
MESNSNNRPSLKFPSVAIESREASKIKLRKFELFKQVFDYTNNSEDYKRMRRPIKPSLPVYMYSRHEKNKFYIENSYYYPKFYKSIDWTILLKKRNSRESSRSSSIL